jgi:uncharacterized membrane protein YqjE
VATPSSSPHPASTPAALPSSVSLSPHASGTREAIGATPTGDLVRQTVEESKELVRVELMLMQDELKEDLRRMKLVAILGAVAITVALLTLSTLILALVLALGDNAGVALGIACALAAIVVVLAALAVKTFPGLPLEKTRARLEQDMRHIKEHAT